VGSYLYLDETEINSKDLSQILRRVIVETLSNIKNPYDYIKKEIEMDTFTGNYEINLKGIAIVGFYMREYILNNKQWEEDFVCENHPWHDFHGDKELYINHMVKDTNESAKNIYDILFEQIQNMILTNQEICYAHWV
jgi:hypothetical protein